MPVHSAGKQPHSHQTRGTAPCSKTCWRWHRHSLSRGTSLSHRQAEGPLLLLKGLRCGAITKGWPRYQGTPGNGHTAHGLIRRAAGGSSRLRGRPTRVLKPLQRALARFARFHRTQPRFPPFSMNYRFTPEGGQDERKPSPAAKARLPPDFHLLKSTWACKPHLTACRAAEMESSGQRSQLAPRMPAPPSPSPQSPVSRTDV